MHDSEEGQPMQQPPVTATPPPLPQAAAPPPSPATAAHPDTPDTSAAGADLGFVTSNLANGDNKLFTKVLNKGDVFVFPQGLIHFQFNIGKYPAIAGLSSHNPGTVTIANAVFGADIPINVDVLSKAF
uniref:Germin-like protein n=1 Tax=Chenopodium quinoa TaxID=63459 RepID=A0A803LLM7_CHEQI